MAVKVSFKVGNRKVSNAEMSDGIDQFISATGVETVDQVANVDRVRVEQLRQKLNYRVARSLEAAVNFAATTMVGTMSKTSATGKAGQTSIHMDWTDNSLPDINAGKGRIETLQSNGTFDQLYWNALSRKTIMKKSKTEPDRLGPFKKKISDKTPREQARQFYIHTGALQMELRRLAKTITTKTGTVTVGYMKGNAKTYRSAKNLPAVIKTGKIQLAFLPKANLKNLPGVMTAEASIFDPNVLFERSLGISRESLKKLRGIDGHHRPLLQPVFTFWALNRIPRIVASTIQNSLK
jgi:hypothetical protein